MAVGWNGADPVVDIDATAYELGTEYLVNTDITITHIRIWTAAQEVNLVGRTGTIWSTGGAVLGTMPLATDLPTGWSTHELPTPVERPSGSRFIVSYGTGGNEGALAQGLASNVVSADGAVTALGFSNATSGIAGRFRVGPNAFPNSGNASHAFYGADIVYSLGIGGNTAPVVTAASVVAIGMTATATITATDAETLTGASYRYDWGDGSVVSVTNHPTISAQHTYAQPGTYPVLLWVTDSEGLTDFVARFVTVSVPYSGPVPARVVLDTLADHAKRKKVFRDVGTNEPRSAPTELPHAAFFVAAPQGAPGGFRIVPKLSGLAVAAMRLDVICRIYLDAKKPPLEDIDGTMLELIEVILRDCHEQISMGLGEGLWIDANGMDTPGLIAEIGYLDQDDKKFRVAEIYIPVIISDYFPQGI